MKKLLLTVGMAGLLGVSMGSAAFAKKYKEIEVSNGGTITGRVLAGEAKPEAEPFLITKDQSVCGEGQRIVEWVRVNGDALLDAVVYLEKVKEGKPFPEETRSGKIDQKACAFVPYLQAIANGGKLDIVNSDPVTHNIHTYEIIGRARRTVINVSQSEQGNVVTKKIKLRKGVVMKVECDVHNFMHGWVFVAKNPYFAIVDENGNFTIDNVPPGKYVLKVWHGRLGDKESKIEVEAGGTVEASFSY